MRLIDADALIGEMYNIILEDGEDRRVFYAVIERQPTIEEPHWIPCSITVNIPDHEVLCCDLRGNMLIGYLYTDENSDTDFGAESDGECLVDCVAWREKPEPWYER